nr:kinetochore protein Spc24 [Cavia porcellus]
MTASIKFCKLGQARAVRGSGPGALVPLTVLTPCRYVAQLYRRISKIEWDYQSEPGTICGIHHGPSVAQPIHLDSAQLSKQFISDYLWSLVDTEW